MVYIYNIHIHDKPEKCNALGICACIVCVYVMRNVHKHLFWFFLHLYFCPLFSSPSFSFILQTGSHYILQADLQLIILLPPPPSLFEITEEPYSCRFTHVLDAVVLLLYMLFLILYQYSFYHIALLINWRDAVLVSSPIVSSLFLFGSFTCWLRICISGFL